MLKRNYFKYKFTSKGFVIAGPNENVVDRAETLGAAMECVARLNREMIRWKCKKAAKGAKDDRSK